MFAIFVWGTVVIFVYSLYEFSASAHPLLASMGAVGAVIVYMSISASLIYHVGRAYDWCVDLYRVVKKFRECVTDCEHECRCKKDGGA